MDIIGTGKTIARIASVKAPEILLGAGIAATVGGFAMSISRAAKGAAERKEALEARIDLALDEEGEKAAMRAYVKEIAAAHALPMAIAGCGIVAIIGGHTVQKNRIAMAASAYNALFAAFNEYRAKTIEKLGEETDRKFIYGEEEVDAEKITTDKDGNEKIKKTKIKVLGSGDGESMYHRLFDRTTSMKWENDADYNLRFLQAQERIFTSILRSRGYVFLSEVYDALGFDLHGYSNAAITGWVLGDGDDYVDFGIYQEPETLTGESHIRFLEGDEPSIWLEFNCDGIIINRI